MAKFVSSNYPKVIINNYEFLNEPINIDLCESLHNAVSANEPTIFIIEFKGTDVIWRFDKEEQRNSEFDRISKNEF